MKDYNKLIADLKGMVLTGRFNTRLVIRAIGAIEELVRERDAAVEVVYGYWAEWYPGDCALILTGEEMLYECSNCTAKFIERSHYCPNCGAKMDEVSAGVG